MQKKSLWGTLFLFLIFVLTSFLILLEKPTGTLQGLVLNEFKQPIDHARVSIDAYPHNKKAFTNAKGEFHFDLVPIDNYYVNVSAKGYQAKYLPDRVSVAEADQKNLGEIILKERDPSLNVSVWSTIKSPEEKVFLTLEGSKVSEIQFTVYKVNLPTFLRGGKLFSELESQKFDPSTVPDFEKVREWQEKIDPADVSEFDKKIPIQIDGLGLYLVHSFASSSDRKLIFNQNLLVNKTNLGFVLKRDEARLLFYATQLDSGQPMANASVEVFFKDGKNQLLSTNAQGIAELNIAGLSPEALESLLGVVSQAGSVAYTYIPYSNSAADLGAEGVVEGEGEEAQTQPVSSLKYRPFIYTDRPLYRPAQKVYFKGLVRSENSQGLYNLVPVMEVPVRLTGPKGDVLLETTLKTNNYGSFWGDFDLEEEADLGYYSIVAQVGGKEFKQDFEVDEYRKPEFKVEITPQQPRYYSGEKISFQVETQYYFGAPVQAELEYTLYKDTFVYSLPGEESASYSDEELGRGYGEVVQEGSTSSDANGRAIISIQSTPADQDQKYILRIVAKDMTEKTVTREGEVLVTAGDFFFSTKRNQYLSMANQAFPLSIETHDYDGKPVARDYQIRVEREKWDAVIHEYSYKKEKTFEGKTDASGRGQTDLFMQQGGYYRLALSGKDSKGRKVLYYDYVWVSGSSKDSEDFGLEKKISIVTDKKKYQAGDIAKVLLVGPTKGASVLLTVEGSKIHQVQVEKLEGFSKQIEIPIQKDWIPNVFIVANVIGKKEVYEDSVELVLSTQEHLLNVEIKPSAELYHPADEISYQVKTLDANGKPMASELSLGVVDESLYALKADSTDIKKFFWGPRPNRVGSTDSLSGFYSGGIAKEDQNLLRRNFKDTAFWAPSVVTNDQGLATVNFKLPDNLTTWRATVVASSLNTQVGQQINRVIASKDLIARIAVPRFFRERDRITLKAILHNYTNQSQSLSVNLGIEGLDFANPEDNKPRSLTLAPKQVSSFDFTVLAKVPGKAKIQLLAKNAAVSDGVELKIPVLPHGLEEHGYSQGEVPPGVAGAGSSQKLALNIPPQVDAVRSQLKLTLDTTFVAQLLGPVSYLIDYPYGCVEQTMSRLLPALMVSDLNRSLGMSDPALDKKIEKVVKKGIRRILNFEHSDGGWGWWKQDETNPFMTAYALYGLWKAQQMGQKIEADVITRGRNALEKLLTPNALPANSSGPLHGSLLHSDTLAFIYYVDALLGGKLKIPGPGDPAFDSLLSQSYLILAFQAKGKAEIAQQLVSNLERKALCQKTYCRFPSGNPKGYGDVETTAWALQAMMKSKFPNQVLRDQVVSWLMSQRKGGMWRQTRETAAVLYALSEYARGLPGEAKGVKVNVDLNGTELEKINVASPHFVRRFTQAKFNEGRNALGLENLMDHTLYYQSDLTYFTQQEDLGAVDNGVRVIREYVGLSLKDFANKVYEVRPIKGPLKLGEMVGVRITLQSNQDLEYLMLEDPLPSGFEVLEGIRFDEKAEYFSEMTVRDEKTALFTSFLKAGSHVFDYAIRPELSGNFHVMPTQVEEMYQPEVNGLSSENKLEVR